MSTGEPTERADRIREIRVSPNGAVLVVQFEDSSDWFRVVSREGRAIIGPADVVSLADWPAIIATDPAHVVRAVTPFSAPPAPDSFTFRPTESPQLVFFEGSGMAAVDHEPSPTEHMPLRSLYILDALLRHSGRRVAREIERREKAGE